LFELFILYFALDLLATQENMEPFTLSAISLPFYLYTNDLTKLAKLIKTVKSLVIVDRKLDKN